MIDKLVWYSPQILNALILLSSILFIKLAIKDLLKKKKGYKVKR